MSDMELTKRAKVYMEKLANGINPIDDVPVSENDVVNNVRLSRCFFYVSDILRQVIENGGVGAPKKEPKSDFNISFEEAQRFQFSDASIPISEITKRINIITENANMKKLTHRHLTDWLISINMLEVEENPDGKTSKKPTPLGNALGITTEIRTGLYGNYRVVLYNRSAQQFIMDNITAVTEHIKSFKK